MNELKFTISDKTAGARIDKCIALNLGEGYSRTYVKHLMEQNFVQVNGKKVKPRYITREGDEVFLELSPLAEEADLIPENIPLNIIYEDDWLVVVDKPAGMVVHPGAGNRSGTLVNALLFHCGKLPAADESVRPGIVHRLDKGTSGVIVAAKNDKALRSISGQFQNRSVKKHYIALVKGRVELDNGIIDAPIARHAVDRKKMAIVAEGGKEARTLYHVIRRFKKITLLRLELLTGRTHQIRVHMRYLGHPVLGDVQYGYADGILRQALHAERLSFSHPDTGERMEFISPVPEDIQAIIDAAG